MVDIRTLQRNSDDMGMFSRRQKEDLIDAYHTIGMVYAERESLKGKYYSFVKCPAYLADNLMERFNQEGFEVSRYNVDFYGEVRELGGFFIKW